LKLGLLGPIGSLEDEAELLQTKFRKKKIKSTVLAKLALAAATWYI